ncbi:MAG: ribosome maturation factor RimP [Firmicutes bacterium]|nr:ribosome maturation factor RimP [Bacillota bacterium]
MAKKKIEDLIRDMLSEFFDANGYELFRTEFVKEGKDWFLRVYIDKMVDGEYVNVGVEDCEAVSRYLSDKLDEEDPIEQNYYLEVSSPGMDRPLLRDKDFVRFAGEVVEIKLYKGFEGKKFYEGVLVERNEDFLVIRDEKDQELNIPRDMISKVNLAVIF